MPTKCCSSIHNFCKLTYGTEFPRFKKLKVNGDDADPLYKFLQQQKGFAGWDESHPLTPVLEKMLSEADPDYKQKPDIKWNFTKFLINKKGMVVARFEPTESIENIAKQIEELASSSAADRPDTQRPSMPDAPTCILWFTAVCNRAVSSHRQPWSTTSPAIRRALTATR